MSYLEAASIQDAPNLEILTFASKSHWEHGPEVMKAWREGYKEPSPDAFEEERVQILRERGDIIGYYALSAPTDGEIKLTHLFVGPEHIKKGQGSELFEAATQQARSMGCTALKIVSDPKAEGFYLHHGAKRTGAVHYPNIPNYSSPILRLDLTPLPTGHLE